LGNFYFPQYESIFDNFRLTWWQSNLSAFLQGHILPWSPTKRGDDGQRPVYEQQTLNFAQNQVKESSENGPRVMTTFGSSKFFFNKTFVHYHSLVSN
jgi:hypothetical protein